MTSINDLNSDAALSISDLLAVWSVANGDTRKVSLNTLAVFLASLTSSQDNKVTQYSAPVTGATIVVNGASGSTFSNSVWLIVTPASALATLTITLPDPAASLDKQEVLVNCTQIITALTVNVTNGTVIGAPSSFAANGSACFRFDGATKLWYKV